LSQALRPPFGPASAGDERSSEPVSYSAQVGPPSAGDEASDEPVSYDAGNVATNVSDSAAAG
jgi:hypothetical protein